MLRRCLFVFPLLLLSACEDCLEDNLGQVPGNEGEGEGPPPPTFPLRPDDVVTYNALGGNTSSCPGGSGSAGDCDRVVSAEFTVQDVSLVNNRWRITANYKYTLVDGFITAAAIAPLILENGIPFGQVNDGDPFEGDGGVFHTADPPTDELTALGFPFFQFDRTDAGEGTVFETAAIAFCDRFTTLDADADCETQGADHKMEVYYRDDQGGGGAKLHHVRAEFHSIGLYCGFVEELVDFQDGVTPRSQAGINAGLPADVQAIFFAPKVERDGTLYSCSCASQKCRNASEGTCLPTDPDAEPEACDP